MGKEINRIRLNRLYSENNIFEEIIFHDGVNIILGEKYDDRSVRSFPSRRKCNLGFRHRTSSSYHKKKS